MAKIPSSSCGDSAMSGSNLPAVYWDSSVFLAWMKKEISVANDLHRKNLIIPVVRAAENGQLLIVTSSLTLVEVARLKPGPTTPIGDKGMIMAFMKNPFLQVRVLDRRTAEIARGLARRA